MKIKDKRLTYNAAQCVKCGDVIESKHRHDFRSCSCGAIFVDGGLEYSRAGADTWANFISLSEYEEYEREEYDWERRARECLENK